MTTVAEAITLADRHRLEGRPAAAEALCRKILEAVPDQYDAVLRLGVACYEQERLDEAEAWFRRATEIRPGDANGWNNLGGMRLERGDTDAAAAYYDAACARSPLYAEGYSNRLMCEQFRAGVTPEHLKALSLVWEERYAPRPPPARLPRRAGPVRLRLGFVSPDLGRTPVGYFLVGLLEALAGDGFETILYSDTLDLDDLSQRMARAAGQWRDMRGRSHAELAAQVRADGVDVLFDLAGHTRGNRLPVFAQRAAPVQITWAGYVGTTGLAQMDYLLADPFQVPPGGESFHTETVLRLPHDYICYAPPEYAPAVAPLPADRTGHITFGAFHNVAKIGERSLALWSRALTAVPDSRIVLKYKKLDQPQIAGRIRDTFATAGIAPERVIIEGTSPHIDMLARYGDVDIALDSLPYSGGLTTCEALWMGVPVVTLPGRTFAGRHALSHLSNAGLPELVAVDEEDYLRIAVGLASDRNTLAELRRSLRPRMAASPLCDAARFARDFAVLMRKVTAVHVVTGRHEPLILQMHGAGKT